MDRHRISPPHHTTNQEQQMSTANHHPPEAERIIWKDASWTIGYESADAQHVVGRIEANTQATLALAYEQRTANLIAFFATLDARPTVYAEIAERLDLA